MHILIIDQCSNDKSYPAGSRTYKKEELATSRKDELLAHMDTANIPAQKLYAGRQQKKIDSAVASLRSNGYDVTRYFVSAGFGLVEEQEELPPYEVTFNEMSTTEIDEWTTELNLHNDITSVLSGEDPFDIIFIPLGEKYYESINLDTILPHIPEESIGVVFNQSELTADYENVVSVPAGRPEAKEQQTIAVALKGKLLENFASHLNAGKEVTSIEDIKAFCASEYPPQAGFGEFDN